MHVLIHQICVPVLRNELGSDERGLLLLRCVRAYVQLDILSSFDIQKESTITLGRSAAMKFSVLVNVSMSVFYLKYQCQ